MSKLIIRNSKYPLPQTYKRRPGQSLDEQIGRLKSEGFKYIIVSGMLLLVVYLEWIKYWFKTPPSPISYTILFLIVLGYSVLIILRLRTKIAKAELGRAGEIEVAQHLENLIRLTGCYIYHDVVGTYQNGKNFNIDHVIVSKYGIFVIETKTWRKPATGEAIIEFDGNSIKATNHPRDFEPIKEARIHLNWLQKHINKIPDRHFELKAIVVYPGWKVPKELMQNSKDVWVMNPKYLQYVLPQLTPSLKTNDIELLNVSLSPLSHTLRNPD